MNTNHENTDPVATDIHVRALIPFLMITFGVAWSILGLYILLPVPMTRLVGALTGRHPLFYLAVYAPAIAAFGIIAHRAGAAGLKRFFVRLRHWRCSPAWAAFLLAGIPLLFIAGAAWKGTLLSEPLPFTTIPTALTALLFAAILGPVEEFGWRGMALPLLQRRMTPFAAALVLGVIWGVWHLPAFLLSGTQQSDWSFAAFFTGCIMLSLIVTPLFNHARGSILLAAAFHFAVMNPLLPDAQPYDSWLLCGVAAVVVWLNRKSMFSRQGGVTTVVTSSRVSQGKSRHQADIGSSPIPRAVTILLLAVLVSSGGSGLAAAPADVFQAELDALRRDYGFPGGTAAYVLAGAPVVVVATGRSDIETGARMALQARMPAASIGKTFVAALALELAADGTLALDAPIARYLGDRAWFAHLPNHADITLRHLLTHTSGLPDHVYTDRFAADLARRWREPGNLFPPEALVGYILDAPPRFATGRSWAYSDTGYILTGLLIESVTGESCFDAITRRFIAPCGLTLTTPCDKRELPGLAPGYVRPDNAFGLPPKTTDSAGRLVWHPGLEWTGGGWISNAADLARWGAALYGGKVLSPAAQSELLKAVPITADSPDIQYGAGVAITRSGPLGPVLGHGGWIPGYRSSLRHYPDRQLTVAFQINTDRDPANGGDDMLKAMETRLARAVIRAHRMAGKYQD